MEKEIIFKLNRVTPDYKSQICFIASKHYYFTKNTKSMCSNRTLLSYNNPMFCFIFNLFQLK